MRQSVDVTRLSRIALSNMEKEGDGADYTAAEVRDLAQPCAEIRAESHSTPVLRSGQKAIAHLCS